MAESVSRQALRETAAALRLNRPVVAVLIAIVAFAGTWGISGKPAWGGAAALGAAVLMFLPLFVWNLISISGSRLMALEEAVTSASAADAAEAAKEVRERRRKILDNARQMVAVHEANKSNWMRTIQVNPAFNAVRPHLSRAYRQSLKSNTTVIMGDELHEISVDAFVRELDRLEREWGLS